jgi:hypothetical protein
MIVALVAACGDVGRDDGDATEISDGEATSTTERAGTTAPPGTTELPTCSDARHLVVFGLIGTLTATDDELTTWTDNPDYVMEARSGAVELVNAYVDSGYQVIYTTRGEVDLDIHGTPYDEALAGWLNDHGFPYDDRARVLTAATDVRLADELLEWARAGGSTDAAYTNLPSDIPAAVSGGVPRERIYTLGEAGDVDGTEPIPNGDLTDHLDSMGAPEEVCR